MTDQFFPPKSPRRMATIRSSQIVGSAPRASDERRATGDARGDARTRRRAREKSVNTSPTNETRATTGDDEGAVARAMLAKPTNAPAPDVVVHEQRESTGAQRAERKKGTGGRAFFRGRVDATREDDDRASTALTRARYHSPARLVRDRRVDCETLTLF